MSIHITNHEIIRVGIAGIGAIGGAVAKALSGGIEGYELTAISELNPPAWLHGPNVGFGELVERCDLIIECLPPEIVPKLARIVFEAGKDLIMISSCALLIHSEIRELQRMSTSRIIVPSGALLGLDGVKALKELGIKKCKIASTKPPMGFAHAPYVDQNDIDLASIDTKTKIFEGNAIEAATGFPANVNVAATLSLAALGPEHTVVEIWADPQAKGNAHEIWVEGEYSSINARIENMPDPANPKSSMLAAQSIVAYLKNRSKAVIVV